MGNTSPSCHFQEEKLIHQEPLFSITEPHILATPTHRCIAGMTFLNGLKQTGIGSGVRISKNLLLTAAHNLYDKVQECENTAFKIYIGANGPTQTFHKAQSFRIPPEFRACQNSKERLQFDYALVKLQHNPEEDGRSQVDAYPALAVACPKCLLSQNIDQRQLEIFGYPSCGQNYTSLDKYGIRLILHQYGMARSNRIISLNPALSELTYAISTLPGHSGSPVIVGHHIIAIHNGGGRKEEENYNIGRLVTYQFLDNLEQWRKEMDGDEFKVEDFCSHINIKRQMKLFSSRGYKKIPQYIQLVLEQSQEQESLTMSGLKLAMIDVTKHAALCELIVNQNQLQIVDLRSNTNLTKLSLYYNRINEIDLTYNTNLIELDLRNNRLSQIILTKNTLLTFVNLSFNQLSSIDLAQNIKLAKLYLSYNQLTSVDLSRNTELTHLNLSFNQFTKLQLKFNTSLAKVDLTSNLIQAIDLSDNSSLRYLYLSYNKLTAADFQANTKLTHLNISFNCLAGIDVSNCPLLINLDIRFNCLVAVNLLSNAYMQNLWMQGNHLRSAVFWFSPSLTIELHAQKSEKCEVILLHRPEHAQSCRQAFNKERDTEQTHCSSQRWRKQAGCKYSFRPVQG